MQGSIPSRRFGRTNLQIPVLTIGGMRFQQSWTDINSSDILRSNQNNIEEIFEYAFQNGFHHIETARHYGSSERQIGWALKTVPDSNRILQTKVPPKANPVEFEKELEISFK